VGLINITHLLKIVRDCTDVREVVAENQRLEPFLAIIGEETAEAYLVVDKHIIDKFCKLTYLLH